MIYNQLIFEEWDSHTFCNSKLVIIWRFKIHLLYLYACWLQYMNICIFLLSKGIAFHTHKPCPPSSFSAPVSSHPPIIFPVFMVLVSVKKMVNAGTFSEMETVMASDVFQPPVQPPVASLLPLRSPLSISVPETSWHSPGCCICVTNGI